MNINNLFKQETVFDIQALTKIMLRNEGWNIFEIRYDNEYDEYVYSMEYLLEDGKFDNTASYDVTVSFGKKNYFEHSLESAVAIGKPIKR